MLKLGKSLRQNIILDFIQRSSDLSRVNLKDTKFSGFTFPGHVSRNLRVSRQSEGEGAEVLQLRDLAMQSLQGKHKPALH